MSKRAVEYVRARWRGLSAMQRWTWLTVAEAYDDETDEALLYRRDLADRLGASPKATFEAVDRLTWRGLLVVRRVRGHATVYLIPGVTKPWKVQDVATQPGVSLVAIPYSGQVAMPAYDTPNADDPQVATPTCEPGSLVAMPANGSRDTPGELVTSGDHAGSGSGGETDA